MSVHRIYRFPEWMETPYKHILLKRQTDTTLAEKAEPVEHEGRMDESLSRSRRLIMEYILCNRFDLFCTFTFSDEKVTDRKDYKALKARFSKWLNNYRNRYDKYFRYLYIPELHKDGSVHFHGVMTTPNGLCCNLQIPRKNDATGQVEMVPNTPGYMDWPRYSQTFGHFSCSFIRDYTGCAGYVSKYMTKDLANWFERNDQIVMHSKGLNKPELVYEAHNEGIPGGITEKDYDGDFCAIGMRDVYQTAPYYTHWVDEFNLYPEMVIAPEDWWKYKKWQEYPGPVDEWKQTDMWKQMVIEQNNKRVGAAGQ